FFSSRRRHTRLQGDWSSDVCSSDLATTSRPWIHHSPDTIRVLGKALASTEPRPRGRGYVARDTLHRREFLASTEPRPRGRGYLEIGRASCRERERTGVGEDVVTKKE